ncbi:MAG: spermidine/putrescine ABC transporter ATP-binding protein [Phototrophicales bacterium]|nr:MAG: spermidine/putrescine ABC transporter ATP-binding protein [Phototrophicales bacterium]
MTGGIKVELRHVVKEFPAGRYDVPVRAVDDVSLTIYDGEFFAMLGPSGCGKTTTLRMIAGFEKPTSGEILIDGTPMQDMPPFHRPVNTVFQDYALFPHMTILQNVMFGLQMENIPKKEAQRRAEEALELVRLPHVGKRKPREISGGQQQRVALARALVKKPRVLLLDEPLGALDLKLRREMQIELKTMQQQLGITFIFVTHDQEEAMTMANRIAVMNGGRVLQIGRPDEIYENPATRFVADFIGENNFLDGQIDHIDGAYARVILGRDTPITARPPHHAPNGDTAVTVAIRPERISLRDLSDPLADVSPQMNSLRGQITQVFYIGTDTRYIIHLETGDDLSARIQNIGTSDGYGFKQGQNVHVLFHPDNTRVLTSL